LPQAEIFHFAGHALTGGKRIGLLLAAGDSESEAGDDADVLSGSELNAGDLHECRLAVLSACSTAAGNGTALVDPGSLVGEFLLAGVPDVVASHWNVDSTVTTRLMTAFYKNLVAGAPVALALNGAANTIRKSPMTAHPYDWAAFSVFGR
jgi:CHAT domain-containing protein